MADAEFRLKKSRPYSTRGGSAARIERVVKHLHDAALKIGPEIDQHIPA